MMGWLALDQGDSWWSHFRGKGEGTPQQDRPSKHFLETKLGCHPRIGQSLKASNPNDQAQPKMILVRPACPCEASKEFVNWHSPSYYPQNIASNA